MQYVVYLNPYHAEFLKWNNSPYIEENRKKGDDEIKYRWNRTWEKSLKYDKKAKGKETKEIKEHTDLL